MDDPHPPKRTPEEENERGPRSPSSRGTDEGQSRIVLDEEGMIQKVSDEASALLDVDPQSLIGERFFNHVHSQERAEVLRDLAEIVVLDKQRATWLLRLKTSPGPWQWFKVEAENQLGGDDPSGIVLRLFERGDD
jgi:hypothetical protein